MSSPKKSDKETKPNSSQVSVRKRPGAVNTPQPAIKMWGFDNTSIYRRIIE